MLSGTLKHAYTVHTRHTQTNSHICIHTDTYIFFTQHIHTHNTNNITEDIELVSMCMTVENKTPLCNCKRNKHVNSILVSEDDNSDVTVDAIRWQGDKYRDMTSYHLKPCILYQLITVL